jgi:lipopolysaccharide export system protein LptA
LKGFRSFFHFIIFFSAAVCSRAQFVNPLNVPRENKEKISLHSEDNQIVDATTDPATQYLNGNVRIYHNGTFMFCDTAILRGNVLKMYHNVVMVQNDTIRLFADSIFYNGDDGLSILYGNIILENGSRKLYTTRLDYDVRNKVAIYNHNARLEDGKSVLLSRRGKYLINEKRAIFAGNVSVTGENFYLLSDSIAYLTDSQITEYYAPVRIRRDTADIYSQGGWFDMDEKKGDFIGNAQYVSGSAIANADTISYDGENDIVLLKSGENCSRYISDKDTAYAFVIYYDRKSEEFRLTGDGFYKNEKNEVKGEEVIFNKQSESFSVKGRSYVSDPPTIIEAASIWYDKSLKEGKADGQVVWQDTSAKTTIYADHVVYRGEEKYMKASNDTGRPMFTTLIDQDTLYLRADTLKSYRIIRERSGNQNNDHNRLRVNKSRDNDKSLRDAKENTKQNSAEENTSMVADSIGIVIPDSLSIPVAEDSIAILMDTIEYFVGDNNVRMYKKDMQSLCDSLTYSMRDSVFTLRGDPFLWSDSTQISGDTIQIFLRDKKVDKLMAEANALIVTTEDLIFFNQIKGRHLQSYFADGKAERMDIEGNAEAIYYILDKDKAYIGVNKTECSKMKFYFKDDKISEIRFYDEPSSKVIPMQKADHESLKVKGFIWNGDKRPQSLIDL